MLSNYLLLWTIEYKQKRPCGFVSFEYLCEKTIQIALSLCNYNNKLNVHYYYTYFFQF